MTPKVNRDRIASLIGDLEKSLSILKKYAAKSKDELLGNLDSLGTIKYYFITAIAACSDICTHISSKERWGIPDSYSSCFVLLKEHQVIDEGFSNKLVNMAKFRNLLVHFYRKIEDEKVIEFLQSELGVFQDYIDVISKAFL